MGPSEKDEGGERGVGELGFQYAIFSTSNGSLQPHFLEAKEVEGCHP